MDSGQREHIKASPRGRRLCGCKCGTTFGSCFFFFFYQKSCKQGKGFMRISPAAWEAEAGGSSPRVLCCNTLCWLGVHTKPSINTVTSWEWGTTRLSKEGWSEVTQNGISNEVQISSPSTRNKARMCFLVVLVCCVYWTIHAIQCDRARRFLVLTNKDTQNFT